MQAKRIIRLTVAAGEVKRGDGLIIDRKAGPKPVKSINRKERPGRIVINLEGWSVGFDLDKRVTVDRMV